MADAQIVYGRPGASTSRHRGGSTRRRRRRRLPTSQATVIDQFDVSNPDTTTLVASGRCPATCSTSSRCRSTTATCAWRARAGRSGGGATQPPPQSQSYVTVLAPTAASSHRSARSRASAPASRSTRCASSATPATSSRSARSTRSTRSTCARRRRRRVAGQIELEGYSAYLHPVGDGLLLGIGGRRPNERAVRRAARALRRLRPRAPAAGERTLGGGSSTQVEYDHHAFLFWAPAGLAVLPMQTYGGGVVTPGGPTEPAGVHRSDRFHVSRSGDRRLDGSPTTRSTGRPRRSTVPRDRPAAVHALRGRHGLEPHDACAASVRLVPCGLAARVESARDGPTVGTAATRDAPPRPRGDRRAEPALPGERRAGRLEALPVPGARAPEAERR